ncbi:major facilitator superfamily transporter [Colletotrichum karsti]|uniref:Major facilitator superfamily transporter n=1 Tax=Colletotrichum karsti TaxID=1095194 RepID=A0A9P6HSS7_9PEZI|nr:major facilitator superfamily transporter [Colletotrichum karsti]KAF9869853.1 major facilitator superfamily transporter [Colletotrichum karsti]
MSDAGISNPTPDASLKEKTSSCNIESIEPIDHENDGRLRSSLVRKFDLRLVPAMFLAYLLFFLDKSNIALARINGLERDLRLVGNQFNTSLAVFSILHILFNIPGNLAVRRVGGAIWLPSLVIAWGIVTISSGFITNFTGLCLTRVFLGLTESSFLGGVLIYLGFFYTADELVLRVGLFYSSTALAGFLGGLMAGGLGQIRVQGFNGWPWIFFIEGALTVILGIGLLFFLPHTPADAKFLTPAERSLAVRRMQNQDRWHFLGSQETGNHKSLKQDPSTELAAAKDPLNWATVKSAIFNVVTLTIAVASFFSIEAIMSFSMFLPTIISVMGFEKLQASLMTAPPNLLALIFTVAICFWSQRSGKAALPLNICSIIGALGYLFLIIGSQIGPAPLFLNVKLQYAGCFLVAMAVNATPPLALTWLSINASPHYVRAIALGFVLSIGNAAAFLASFTYIKTEAPQYLKGHCINFGCLFGLLLIGIALPLEKMTAHGLLFFIPGNPGLVDYYTDFFDSLKTRIGWAEGHIHVHGRDLFGFRDESHEPFSNDNPPYDVEHQIEAIFKHLASLRRTDSARNTPGKTGEPYDFIILAGHSVGSYIALEIFHRHLKDPSRAPHLKLHAGMLLFPTVTHMAQSPSGKRLELIRTTSMLNNTAHIVAQRFLDLWPAWALRWFVSNVLGMGPKAAEVTTGFLKSRDSVWQAIHMGKDEMKVITEDKWDQELWGIEEEEGDASSGISSGKRTTPKFYMLFGKKDHWVADHFRDHFLRAREKHIENGRARVEIDEKGIPHAFCTTEKNSDVVAEKVAEWLREVWDGLAQSSS